MHQPELGQALFSNSSFLEYGVPSYVENGIQTLGAMLGAMRTSTEKEAWYMNPCNNVGYQADFSNSVFSMRAYCWCEGEVAGHENGCPANFETEGFRVSWYKHVKRSSSCNKKITAAEWQRILSSCIASLGTSQTG